MNTDKMRMFVPKSKMIYNLNIYQVGYEKCGASHSFGPVIRDFYVLHFLISGKGEYHIRDRVFHLSKGDCFLVVPNEKMFYKASPEDPYEYFWVAFQGQSARKILEKAEFYRNDNFVYRNDEQYERIYGLMNEMNLLTTGSNKNNLLLIGYLYLLLGFMIKDESEYEESGEVLSLLEMANKYISTNYQNDITVDALAKFLNLHRSSLYRLFKRNYGMSPIEYIVDYRLDKALFMIKNSDCNTNQIAYSCGFKNITYFYRAFKKKFQKTPKEVRKLV